MASRTCVFFTLCFLVTLPIIAALLSRSESSHTSHVYRPIASGSNIGRALENLAGQKDVRRILEIGGMEGKGSTSIMAGALKEKEDAELTTVELSDKFASVIRGLMQGFPVTVVRGTSVSSKDLVMAKNDAEMELWTKLKVDVQGVEKLPHQPVMRSLCESKRFDVVVLDGSPYAAYAEMEIARDVCRPKYLVVMDSGVLPPHKMKVDSTGVYEGRTWTIFRNPDARDDETPSGPGELPPKRPSRRTRPLRSPAAVAEPATQPPPPPSPPPSPAPAPLQRRESYEGFNFWSTDMHISPIFDLKDLFKKIKGPSVIDKSLSGACGSLGTCARNLRVLNSHNSYNLNGGHQLKKQFYQAYQKDAELASVDAFVCNHPAATCEIYLPFNKSVVVVATTRFEQGREDSKEGWQYWADVVRKLGKSSRHVVGGNNLYDVEYIRYFTGLSKDEVHWIPSYCGYTGGDYHPDRTEFLFGSMHVPGAAPGEVWTLARSFIDEAKGKRNSSLVFKGIHEVYGRYNYNDLGRHPAIIHVPYQVSIMSLFEHYRMNIPLYFPTLDFLCELHKKYYVVPERTFWPGVRSGVDGRHDIVLLKGSLIPKHPEYPMEKDHDPNNDFDEEGVRHWLSYSDFYQWPHVQLYSSWDDLVDQLSKADFKAISNAMREENKRLFAELEAKWVMLFERMWKDRPAGGYAVPQTDYETAMRDLGF